MVANGHRRLGDQNAMMVDQSELHRQLDYNPETGVFRRKLSTAQRVKVGDIAGSISSTTGYLRIMINGKRYLAHRLAWLYVFGSLPDCDVDHVDGCKTNNRIANLRLATRSQNIANAGHRKNNRLGLKGVHRTRTGNYAAQIRVDGKKMHLGRYDCPAAAHLAYVVKASSVFGEYASFR